jgi:hypothetical protein
MKLILSDKACAAIAAAIAVSKRVDDVKDLVPDACALKLRAERRLEELIAAQKALLREQGRR